MSVQSVFRPDLFAGRVAVVTGGGSGIGKAIARELIALGAKVVIAARKQPRLEQAVEDLGGSPRVASITCNIRDEQQVRAMLQFAVERFGRLDFLVNNAGGQFPSPASLVRTKGWNAVIETNLTGTFLCCREAFSLWMEENGGAIVNIIADMFRGFPGMVHTGAARAGVDNITKTLAVEWAHRGIRINSVAPGTIRSSGIETYDPAFQEMFYSMADNIPAKRLGTEEEVAAAVMYLLSPAASFVTGETLRVDGGGSLWRLNWDVPQHERMPPWGGRHGPRGDET
ncbi:MAG: 2,4-dienoyl-CoA reductase [Rickettsiales bacterium]|nr:2,4-dienoyl-CoA reductase [Rickettsiales bacterium]|tara:strand:- start:3722 stop:4573 length:852 start_codon:yes stop_codon:yes gene_type:complete